MKSRKKRQVESEEEEEEERQIGKGLEEAFCWSGL